MKRLHLSTTQELWLSVFGDQGRPLSLVVNSQRLPWSRKRSSHLNSSFHIVLTRVLVEKISIASIVYMWTIFLHWSKECLPLRILLMLCLEELTLYSKESILFACLKKMKMKISSPNLIRSDLIEDISPDDISCIAWWYWLSHHTGHYHDISTFPVRQRDKRRNILTELWRRVTGIFQAFRRKKALHDSQQIASKL